MSENMYCKDQKINSKKFRDSWDRIFNASELDDSGHKFCNECGLCIDCGDCKCND